MSQSSDPNHFFQTSDSIAASKARSAKAKNKNGDPIDLKVKILAAHAWTAGQVLVACADGMARLVDLKFRKVARSFTGAVAPLTCLAIQPGQEPILYAGCWDKSIHSWDLKTGRPLRRFTGHTDFVKCLVCAVLDGKPYLLSGSADASIILWDVVTGARIDQGRNHTRGVLSMAIHGSRFFSADSVRDVREWCITSTSLKSVSPASIVVHETSVNSIRIYKDDAGETELWTASADKTAKRLVHRTEWEADTTLDHPDFVKDILMIDAQGQYVATACRDGDVRVWETGSGKLICTYDGHFDEVTALVWDGGSDFVSVSLDGTVRIWKNDRASMLEAMRLKTTAPTEDEEERKKPAMTAEEEAELAELMDSD